MLKEFKEFALRGNVVDLAVGIIIGAAFSQIVNSLVNDIIMPPIGLILGGVDFKNFYLTLKGPHPDTLAEAQAQHAVTINYGLFINNIINFLIVALVIFILVRAINRMRREPEKQQTPTTKNCPYCYEVIPIQATRCPQCTSQLAELKNPPQPAGD